MTRLLPSGIAVVVLSMLALPVPAIVTFDAPGHVYTDRQKPIVRGGHAGVKFVITDWRGRLTGHGGVFGMDGAATLSQMPTAGFAPPPDTNLVFTKHEQFRSFIALLLIPSEKNGLVALCRNRPACARTLRRTNRPL